MGERPTHIRKTKGGHTARRPRRVLGEVFLLVVRSVLWIACTAAGTALNMWGAVVLLLLIAPSSVWGYLALGLGAALAGGIGGAIAGFGQVLALRRWLDGAASLGSFFSTILASSSALAAATTAGWWVYTSAGDLPGVLSGVAVYGCVFGLIQRPMLDYMSGRSILWIPANAVASLLGALTVLVAFDVSGGRRDMLQFRYAGIAYSLVVGAAFLWMTRETRRAITSRPPSQRHTAEGHTAQRHTAEGYTAQRHTAEGYTAAERAGQQVLHDTPGAATDPMRMLRDAAIAGPALLEVHEHRVYRVYSVPQDLDRDQAVDVDSVRDLPDRGDSSSQDRDNGPDVIDATYRVIS